MEPEKQGNPFFSYYQEMLSKFKPIEIEIFIESSIQFTVKINNPNLTCGWLQSEVIRKYYEQLYQQALSSENSHLSLIQIKDIEENNISAIHQYRRQTRE